MLWQEIPMVMSQRLLLWIQSETINETKNITGKYRFDKKLCEEKENVWDYRHEPGIKEMSSVKEENHWEETAAGRY